MATLTSVARVADLQLVGDLDVVTGVDDASHSFVAQLLLS